MRTQVESPADIVRRVAAEEGVDPRLLDSIWAQESLRSTDPGLRHPAIKSGPRAGEYARGPFGIMSFHGDIPDDIEGQARWAARHLKERGVRGYYGTGKAPAGYPSTDEYEAQVMARAGKPLQVASAGRADISSGLLSQAQPDAMEEADMPQSDMMGESTIARLMQDPMFLMGAAVLSQGGGATGDIGRGLLGGTAAWQGQQDRQVLQEQRRMQAQMLQAKQQQMLRQQAAWQQLMGGGGGGGGGQPAAGGGGALDNLLRYAYASQDPDLMAKVMGIQLEAQKAALPYQGMTMADQAAAQDRAMQRELEINRERDAGRLPPAGGVPGAAEAMPGGSPAQGRELYQKGAESLILLDADRLKSLNERAGAAGRMLPSIKRMLTDNANAPSGRLAPTQLWAGQVAESVDGMLGTKFKDWFGGDATIATAEQFFADSANLIREQIKALGSGNAISNVDLLFTRETLPSLMQTKEGRQKMLEALQSDMENLQISAKQADTHFRANKGKGLEGFEPANLKRPAFLKKYFVVGPGGERYEMANKAAADSVVKARPGFRVEEE